MTMSILIPFLRPSCNDRKHRNDCGEPSLRQTHSSFLNFLNSCVLVTVSGLYHYFLALKIKCYCKYFLMIISSSLSTLYCELKVVPSCTSTLSKESSRRRITSRSGRVLQQILIQPVLLSSRSRCRQQSSRNKLKVSTAVSILSVTVAVSRFC